MVETCGNMQIHEFLMYFQEGPKFWRLYLLMMCDFQDSVSWRKFQVYPHVRQVDGPVLPSQQNHVQIWSSMNKIATSKIVCLGAPRIRISTFFYVVEPRALEYLHFSMFWSPAHWNIYSVLFSAAPPIGIFAFFYALEYPHFFHVLRCNFLIILRPAHTHTHTQHTHNTHKHTHKHTTHTNTHTSHHPIIIPRYNRKKHGYISELIYFS